MCCSQLHAVDRLWARQIDWIGWAQDVFQMNVCSCQPPSHTRKLTHAHTHMRMCKPPPQRERTRNRHAAWQPFPSISAKDAPISTGGSICFAAAQHTARPVCLAERVCIGRPHRCACMRVGCALARPDAHRHTDCGRTELGRLALYGASRRAVPVRQRFCGTRCQ